jgi:hypothetical protein
VFWINNKKYWFITGKKEVFFDDRLAQQVNERMACVNNKEEE